MFSQENTIRNKLLLLARIIIKKTLAETRSVFRLVFFLKHPSRNTLLISAMMLLNPVRKKEPISTRIFILAETRDFFRKGLQEFQMNDAEEGVPSHGVLFKISHASLISRSKGLENPPIRK